MTWRFIYYCVCSSNDKRKRKDFFTFDIDQRQQKNVQKSLRSVSWWAHAWIQFVHIMLQCKSVEIAFLQKIQFFCLYFFLKRRLLLKKKVINQSYSARNWIRTPRVKLPVGFHYFFYVSIKAIRDFDRGDVRHCTFLPVILLR